jgi:uncharacterized protein YuzE
MKIKYAAEVDALYITLTDKEIEDTDEVSKDLVVDYDKDGDVVGVEVLNASLNKDFEGIIKQYIERVKAA